MGYLQRAAASGQIEPSNINISRDDWQYIAQIEHDAMQAAMKNEADAVRKQFDVELQRQQMFDSAARTFESFQNAGILTNLTGAIANRLRTRQSGRMPIEGTTPSAAAPAATAAEVPRVFQGVNQKGYYLEAPEGIKFA